MGQVYDENLDFIKAIINNLNWGDTQKLIWLAQDAAAIANISTAEAIVEIVGDKSYKELAKFLTEDKPVGRTLTVYSEDITDREFNRKITCSDDPEEHTKYHLRTALMHAANRITGDGLAFPLKLSLETIQENANMKLVLIIREIDEDD